MIELKVFNKLGEDNGNVAIDDSFIKKDINTHVLALAVDGFLAKARLGTASAKTRSEVRGGGAKPWKQKGTGRARAGSRRSPLWRGGGVIFPPKPKSYEKKTSRKEKKVALVNALSLKVNSIFVLDNFIFDKISTKEAFSFLKKTDSKSALIVTEVKNENLFKSFNNIQNIKVICYNSLNAYDILRYEKLFFVRDAIEKLPSLFKKKEV